MLDWNLNARTSSECFKVSYFHVSYFSLKATENNKKAQSLKINSTPDLLKSTEDVTFAEAVKKELKATTSIQNRGKYALNIPSRIRTEVGKFALCYGTQAARKRFRLKYAQYEFKRSTLNERK